MTKQRTPRPTGRPRVYADKVQLTVMFERDELAAITDAAGDESLSTFVRRAATRAAKAQLRKERKESKS